MRYASVMLISDSHNFLRPGERSDEGRFGVRVSLPADDPFSHLVNPDWSRTHWYATADARDAALRDMARRHEYSRNRDKPTLVFESVERDADEH